GDTGPDAEGTLREEGDRVLEPVRDAWPFRPRADERHVAPQDIDQLRNLVEPGLAQEAADRGDAWIVLGCPDRAGPRLGIDIHAAELVHHEQLGTVMQRAAD